MLDPPAKIHRYTGPKRKSGRMALSGARLMFSTINYPRNALLVFQNHGKS